MSCLGMRVTFASESASSSQSSVSARTTPVRAPCRRGWRRSPAGSPSAIRLEGSRTDRISSARSYFEGQAGQVGADRRPCPARPPSGIGRSRSPGDRRRSPRRGGHPRRVPARTGAGRRPCATAGPRHGWCSAPPGSWRPGRRSPTARSPGGSGPGSGCGPGPGGTAPARRRARTPGPPGLAYS